MGVSLGRLEVATTLIVGIVISVAIAIAITFKMDDWIDFNPFSFFNETALHHRCSERDENRKYKLNFVLKLANEFFWNTLFSLLLLR